MGLVNYETIKNAFIGWQALFYQTLAKPSGINWRDFVQIIPSTGPEENLSWIGDIPGVTEFVGRAVEQELRAYKWAITNKKWHSGPIAIDLAEFEDDKLGLQNARIKDLAMAFDRHILDLIANLIINGLGTALCYDGQYFCDTDHSEGDSGTQVNKTTAALNKISFQAALAYMRIVKSDTGQYIYPTPTHLFVGPSNEALANELVNAREIIVTDTTIRPQSNFISTLGIKPVVLPQLSGSYAAYWGLADCSREVKPFGLTWRIPPQFVQQTSMESDSVFNEDKLKFKGRARYNAGYLLWQLFHGSTGAS